MLGIRGYIQFNMGERSDYGWYVEGSSGFIRNHGSHGSHGGHGSHGSNHYTVITESTPELGRE